MQRLSGLRVYIGGPIQWEKDLNSKNNVFFDRAHLSEFLLNKNVKIFNPRKIEFKGVSELQDRKYLFDNNQFQEIRRQMKIIVRKDLRCIDISDFGIFYLPKDVKTVGTIHEIIESDRQKKPTIIICPEGKKYIPAWIFGIVPLNYMFESLDELINYLNLIDTKEEVEDDRWQFIINNITEIETNC